jgi:hypothetical protein
LRQEDEGKGSKGAIGEKKGNVRKSV